MPKLSGRTKNNFIGAYVNDALKAKLDNIRRIESERLGAKLTLNQVMEMVINKYPAPVEAPEETK